MSCWLARVSNMLYIHLMRTLQLSFLDVHFDIELLYSPVGIVAVELSIPRNMPFKYPCICDVHLCTFLQSLNFTADISSCKELIISFILNLWVSFGWCHSFFTPFSILCHCCKDISIARRMVNHTTPCYIIQTLGSVMSIISSASAELEILLWICISPDSPSKSQVRLL